MLRRWLLVALLLLATMAAAGLSPGLRVRPTTTPVPGSAPDAATGGAAVSHLEPAVVRVTLDDRRSAVGQRLSSKTTKAGLWLVAVLVLIAGLLPLRRRWSASAGRAAPVPLPWWSPFSSRGPPSSLLAVR